MFVLFFIYAKRKLKRKTCMLLIILLSKSSKVKKAFEGDIIKKQGGARDVMVIVVENGHGDTGSNPR